MPAASGVEVLLYLMVEHGLHQTDLPEVGSQGVISEIIGCLKRRVVMNKEKQVQKKKEKRQYNFIGLQKAGKLPQITQAGSGTVDDGVADFQS
jgi:hypothetical protein